MDAVKLNGGLLTSLTDKLIERWIKKKFCTDAEVNLKGLYVAVEGTTTKIHLDIQADIPTEKLNEVIKTMI